MAALKPKSSVRAVRLRLADSDLLTILAAVKSHPGSRPHILEFVGKNSSTFELPADDEFSVGDERSLLESLSAFDPDRPS